MTRVLEVYNGLRKFTISNPDKVASNALIFKFLGSNFLIQRLPDEQEIGHKSPGDDSWDSRLFHRETEVRRTITNFRPPEDKFYRRQPSDHPPTTICK